MQSTPFGWNKSTSYRCPPCEYSTEHRSEGSHAAHLRYWPARKSKRFLRKTFVLFLVSRVGGESLSRIRSCHALSIGSNTVSACVGNAMSDGYCWNSIAVDGILRLRTACSETIRSALSNRSNDSRWTTSASPHRPELFSSAPNTNPSKRSLEERRLDRCSI